MHAATLAGSNFKRPLSFNAGNFLVLIRRDNFVGAIRTLRQFLGRSVVVEASADKTANRPQPLSLKEACSSATH
jgi:hypothetical protein